MDTTKLLDTLENICVDSVYSTFKKSSMDDITKEQARNLVGKIGVRIIFGQNIDELLAGNNHA